MTLVGHKALADREVRRRKRLSRNTCDRHTTCTSLERVDRRMAPTIVVHVVQEAINPCGTPLPSLLRLLYCVGKLVPFFHQLIQDCLGHLNLAGRGTFLQFHTTVEQNLCYLFGRVHILATKPRCDLCVLLLFLMEMK